ncbi:hypothetical protein FQN54_007239 [Arachnomyces sp. PD_36]|nr:hypothetical protein FQN54_007239 [Arachnomyces sp. PD_36]
MTNQSLPPDDEKLSYPKKFRAASRMTVSESAAVKQALSDGLNPNELWDEDTLILPDPKGGCVVPGYVEDSETWPHYNTPLHRAMDFSDFESAELLLQHGSDINLYNSAGQTPLHEAVGKQNHDAVRFLLEHGADVNKVTLDACVQYKDKDRTIRGCKGGLSLQMALSSSDATTLRLLVEAGADMCVDSQHPWTALDLALLGGDQRAIEVLLPQLAELPVKPQVQETSIPKSDYSGPSRDLLGITKSNTLVPPSELYGAYRYAIQQLEKRRKIDSDAVAADVSGLVRDFFEILQETASQDQQSRIKKCASCLKFQSEVSCISETKAPFEFSLHENRQHLNDSADKGCPLCGITADALDQAEKEPARGQDSQRSDPNSPVMLKTDLYISKTGSVHLSALYASCGKLRISMDISTFDERFTPTLEDHDEPDVGTGSASAMQTVKRWLHACRTDDAHSACREAYCNEEKRESFPRRLLYVGGPNEKPRIVEAQGIQDPYCALSYCWGTKHFLATTRDNLSQNMNGIPLDSFPAVMADAISVVRMLGYRYLWIDALCIVQDDEKDWAHQIAGMHVIYSNADLTISSLVSSDCHTGLFRPRTLRVLHPVALDFWEPKQNRQSGMPRAVFPEWAQDNPGIDGPVHTRAWTLQEQLLSTRILYFGEGILHWECLEGYTLEVDPARDNQRCYNYRSELERRTETKRTVKAILSNDKRLSGGRQGPFELWKRQLEEFTKRNLTKSSDRLPAFASISKTLMTVAKNEFLCGIWNGDKLLESLCWNVVDPDTVSKIPDMPSWTWAAVNKPISYDLVDRSGREDVEILPGATLVSVNVEVNDSLNLASGSLTIRGKLCLKSTFRSSFFDAEEELGINFLLSLQFGVHGNVFLDQSFESLENCYSMNLLSFPQGPPYQGYGYPRWPDGRLPATVKLLLQKVDGESDVFRRVGIGILPDSADDNDYTLEEDENMIPLTWLMKDEEVFENRKIIIV